MKSKLLAVSLCAIPLLTSASFPPEYVDLTPQRIKAMGFKYTIWKKGAFSYIDLNFPSRVDGKLTPHSAHVKVSDLSGNILVDSTTWVSEKHLVVANRYNHQQTDIFISVVFCGAHASNCKDFGIGSVSKFIKDNAKPADILQE